MKLDFFGKLLSEKLRSLGRLTARRPLHFIIIPVILSACLSIGFLNVVYNTDIEYLASVPSGRSEQNKRVLTKLFPVNTSKDTDLARVIDQNVHIFIIMTNKNEDESVLKEELFEEALNVDSIVRNITVLHNGEIYTYEDICGKVQGQCFFNTITRHPLARNIFRKSLRVKYPLEIDKITFSYYEFASNFGGVVVDENGFMRDAKALRLLYAKDNSNIGKAAVINEWEKAVLKQLQERQFNYLNVYAFAFSEVKQGWKVVTDDTFKLAFLMAATIAIFSMLSLMTNNWVASKPWLGLAGCCSAVLSVISAYGLMPICGMETTFLNNILPFLVLGTEIDNTYVLVAAWRRSRSRDDVETRMGDTYQEAAVSITITSLTNFSSFCVGMTAPFPVVKLFSIYAAASIFFSYVYQITFFGGCMALDGYREERRLHGLTFRDTHKGMKKQECTVDEIYNDQDIISKIFKEKIGTVFTFVPIKVLVIFLFFLSLSVGILGLFHLEEGSELKNLVPPDENTVKYTEANYKYFTQHPYPLHVIVNKTLNYADLKVQESIEDMLNIFGAHPNIDDSIRYSWLHFYRQFLSSPFAPFVMYGYNPLKKDDFINSLQSIFLQFPSAQSFQNDIIFNENHTEIIGSRFILFCKDIDNKDKEKKFLHDLWRIADKSEIPVSLYSLLFKLVEQGVIIKDVLLQLTWVTTLIILLIFCIFIPNFISALFISIVVMSVLVETVGFMAFWKISLDMFSLVVLLMCIGFSINYPTHIAFFFSTAKDKTSNGKLKHSIGHVGFPIFQSCISTILGVSALTFRSAYIYTTFFKIVLLIALGTSIHAMFILPVFLSLMEKLLHVKNETRSKTMLN